MIEQRYYELLKVMEKIKDIDSGVWKLEKHYDRENQLKQVLLETFYDGVHAGRVKERTEQKQAKCSHEWIIIKSHNCYKEYICNACNLTRTEDTGD